MANHPPVSIIVAATENQVIGKAGGMPWHLPNDLRFFKEKTHGHVLLMGRKTWDSIGRALPGRTTVVLTQNRSWQADGTTVVHSLKEGLDAYAALGLFIAGGAQLFRQALELGVVDQVYLTRIHTELAGDTFFPALPAYFRLTWQEAHPADDRHAYAYTFQLWKQG